MRSGGWLLQGGSKGIVEGQLRPRTPAALLELQYAPGLPKRDRAGFAELRRFARDEGIPLVQQA